MPTYARNWQACEARVRTLPALPLGLSSYPAVAHGKQEHGEQAGEQRGGHAWLWLAVLANPAPAGKQPELNRAASIPPSPGMQTQRRMIEGKGVHTVHTIHCTAWPRAMPRCPDAAGTRGALHGNGLGRASRKPALGELPRGGTRPLGAGRRSGMRPPAHQRRHS